MDAAMLLFIGFAAVSNPKNYTIDLSQTTKEVKSGQSGQVYLHIVPADGFKVSAEAPLKINLAAEGLKLHKTKLGHDDAKDKKSTAPEFGVKFAAPEEGDKSVAIDATFFVCDERICERKQEKISVAINVTP
jgi:hypothetical protein